ncbi:MAG: ribonuclease R [bacterium]
MAKKLKGKIERHERGYGFLVPDKEKEEDIFIPPGQLKGAMTGDHVLVTLKSSKRGKNPVGQVVNILERGVSKIIGTIRITPEQSVVIPDSIRLGEPVRVPDHYDSSRVENGELVEVEIENYDPLEGVVIDVLGKPGDPKVEEKVILKKYDLYEEFSDEVEQAAEELPDSVDRAQQQQREDLTDLTVLAIDPIDAKDRDDAVSVGTTRTGNYRVGVHITDVSSYVQPGDVLDEEARERGTSTYLAAEVIPMFPKKFSNGIGSLQQDEDRLAVSVFLIVDPAGRVIDTEFTESVINIDACLSYGEVDDYLEDGDLAAGDKIAQKIDTMIDVSQRMRARRQDRGSLDFDLPEVRFELQEGEIEEIIPVEHTRSHQLIEEFMIGANEAVAEFLTSENAPCLYRIHEPPPAEDIEEFSEFLNGLGYTLPPAKEVTPVDFQAVLEESRGSATEKIIAWNMLRTLQKARYSPENMGHFGLASKCYAHFTSPIRRYPDLVVHRVLKELLQKGQISGELKDKYNQQLPELATHTSEKEQLATEAERESVNVKLLEFMRDKVGEEREAYITSVMNFGCFAQLENTLEGLIHVSSLDDYYVYNEADHSLIGERSGRTLHIGDRVRVQITRVDIPSRELDFKLLEVIESHFGDSDG